MQDKILFIDTETGGLDPKKHPLLSIAFVLWENFSITDQIEIFINDGNLAVNEKAMEINRIDLDKHRLTALTPLNAIIKMKKFLTKHFEIGHRITLGGHNINFDVNFLRIFLEKNSEDFNNYFSHRFVDTSSILYYLYLAGKLRNKSISSDEAFKIFDIQINNRHSALSDAIGTANLFTKLINRIKNNMGDIVGNSNFKTLNSRLRTEILKILNKEAVSVSYIQTALNPFMNRNDLTGFGVYDELMSMIKENVLESDDKELYPDSIIHLKRI
jgi:DNA polymerase III alpha subunit (gram-positive type)